MAGVGNEVRYRAADLVAYATALFAAAGCDGDKPATVAAGLVEADLLGHTTHGLGLAPAYLRELESGAMTARGEPAVVADRGAAVTWDGRRLPGVWLTARAVDLAAERAATHGVATVVVRRSHHIACLAAFLQRATDRGMMVTVASSDPAAASVAPFGGRQAVLTPDPIAAGIPTDGDPILIDISASVTTNGLSDRLRREGKRFPGPWALDAAGHPTDDPAALFADPPGTLLPTGGADHGHKGYGLALLIEALTQGLGGFGRADGPTGWGRVGLRAGDRSRGVRRGGRVSAADGVDRRRLPGTVRRPRASMPSACRANAAWRTSGGRWPKASALLPRHPGGAGPARGATGGDTAEPDRTIAAGRSSRLQLWRSV